MVSFQLGKEIKKDVLCLVTSMGQRKNSESPPEDLNLKPLDSALISRQHHPKFITLFTAVESLLENASIWPRKFSNKVFSLCNWFDWYFSKFNQPQVVTSNIPKSNTDVMRMNQLIAT